MSAASAGTRIITEAEMPAAAVGSVAGGMAALFSMRSPDKSDSDGPNEDAAGVFAIDSSRGVLAVADGMGGLSGGAAAARLALEGLDGALAKAVADSGESLRSAILDAFERANESVLDLGVGAGTTLAVAEIHAGSLRPYHVGDSGILVVGQRGKVKLQTVAHSPVGYAVEAGLLDADAALHHDERHLLSNAIGSVDMRIEVGSPLRLAARDTVLIASDGLFDNLSPSEIVEQVRTGSLEETAALLAQRCAERMGGEGKGLPSKADDLSFVLFRLN